ncbi:MAG: hypothetical protein AAB874_01240, partial [Patescibacteria group bacterium]
ESIALDPAVGTGDGAKIVSNIISALIGLFLVIGFVMALFHFMFGAIRWITASGDKTALQNAQERMTQAMIGLIILAAVWAIMLLVGKFVGLDFPNFILPTITGKNL